MYSLELKDNIGKLIYNIRGKEVMLDSDLARLYQCKNGTKEINQAVKNNPKKFPERFSWKLTDEESEYFLVNYFDQKGETRGGRFKNPRVFTEQGVAMLATIIKSDIATDTSIKIMDAFVAMRHYIGNNEYRLSNVETKIIKHDNDIKLLQEAFDKFEEKKIINEVYFNGQIYDAYSRILNIFKEAKESLIIIDSYADNTLLDIIKRLNIDVILITNKLLTKKVIDKYNLQYNNLRVIFNGTFHDRYFILDNKTIYHCGTSINRIGHKTFSINLISDDEVCKSLFEFIKKQLII